MVPEIDHRRRKKGEKFLRKKTVPFDFKKFTRKEINDLIVRMRRIMHAANGIGLSANQIGLGFFRVRCRSPRRAGRHKILCRVQSKTGENRAKIRVTFEEGCLSVPGKWGEVDARGTDRRERL